MVKYFVVLEEELLHQVEVSFTCLISPKTSMQFGLWVHLQGIIYLIYTFLQLYLENQSTYDSGYVRAVYFLSSKTAAQNTLYEKNSEFSLVYIFSNLNRTQNLRKSPHRVWIMENDDQKKPRIWIIFTHF